VAEKRGEEVDPALELGVGGFHRIGMITCRRSYRPARPEASRPPPAYMSES
jgi:hypothetical protein